MSVATPGSVLVTGSSGTIGTALMRRLDRNDVRSVGADVVPNRWFDAVDERTIQADLRDLEQVNNLPGDVDLIVHLGANARVHQLVEEPRRARDNFDMTFNVLEYAREVGADVVFASSREVYASSDQIVHSEVDTSVDECESPYTASKVGGEALVKSYQNCYDIDASILRFSNVYGRYDASDRVIPLFIAQASRGVDLTVFGNEKVLDFTYLDDCIDGVMQVIEQFNKAKGTTFNIASGQGTALLDLAETIAAGVDEDVSVHVEPNRTGEISRYVADISKAERILGYEPDCSIEEGLDATIEWYQNRADLFDEIV